MFKINLKKYFHYCMDNTNDKGWGCCYRSIQALMNHVYGRHPSISEMMLYSDKKINWIEPHVGKYYIKDPILFCYVKHGDFEQANKNSLFGGTKNYKVIYKNRKSCETFLKSKLHSDIPIVCDNGVYAYLLIGYDDENYYFMDPHDTKPKDYKIPKNNFYRYFLWMMLTI